MLSTFCLFVFFFFNDTATTEIYTLSLHDALPISVLLLEQRHVASPGARVGHRRQGGPVAARTWERERCIARQPSTHDVLDRKSTRLNSSHGYISYAVFCLKKKKKHKRSNH